MQILVFGNCQAVNIARVLGAMLPHAFVSSFHPRLTEAKMLRDGRLPIGHMESRGSRVDTLAPGSDLVLFQHNSIMVNLFKQAFPKAESKVRLFPRLPFSGYHPDMITLKKNVASPTAGYHSSIAVHAWMRGLTVAQTLALFEEEVFDSLGFFEYWNSGVQYLTEAGAAAGLPLDRLIKQWTAKGVWMHTFNHPKLPVVADLARALLEREGIAFIPDVEQSVADNLEDLAVWSVYPAIAKRLGCEGAYRFLPSKRERPSDPSWSGLDLPQFIEASFQRYATYRKEDFVAPRLASDRYQNLKKFIRRPSRGPARAQTSTAAPLQAPSAATPNPYQGLPDHQFWRRALERVPMAEVDPVVAPRFRLGRTDRVATAGSCFAQHIARTLVSHGFNYFIPEHGEHLSPEEAQRRNYGVFSARYGNLYTTRQLLQLFERAYGRFTPLEQAWTRPDGRLADPFRPQIEPEGFATLEDLERSREAHFAAVRAMFEQLDVLVFTLGLTEAWRSRVDGAVYPLAPGVAAGTYDPERHAFVNFTVAEVTADLQAFVLRLLRVNPRARLILTVSPVPLIATYEARHVLVSTTYSKSVLRVAAEEICQLNPQCAYFPSYEIITGNYTRSAYYEDDLRSVKHEGVDHVMRLFLAHYSDPTPNASLAEELMRENAELAEVICDEEAIEAAAG